MATTQDYIDQLKIDKQNLVSMLNDMGVEANDTETFTSLTPKVGKIVTDPILQNKTIEITENGTTNIVADEGYDGLNNVDVTVNVEGKEDLTEELTEQNEEISTQEVSIDTIIEALKSKAGGGEEMVKYSTQEQVVGEWIDGRPLYRKVVAVSVPTVTTDGTYPSNAVFTVANNLNTLRLVDGWIILAYQDGSSQIYKTPYMNNAGYVVKMFSAIRTNKEGAISVSCNAKLFSQLSGFAIIEYTKTTD